MIIDFIHFLTEATNPRTPHPEDEIFNGSALATQAINGLVAVTANPGGLTIKWDGKPALIFGRTESGQLAVMDKYMFDRGVLATSPEDWQKYDTEKATGTQRPELYQQLANIWPSLDAAVINAGFYWGDLLYTKPLRPVQGQFIFRPNLVEYRVPESSKLGKLIAGTQGGIVVHQYFSNLGSSPTQWTGAGLSNIPGGIAIITPDMGIKFNLNKPVQLVQAAKSAVRTYGSAVDELFASIPQSTKDRIKTYFNKRITNQTTQDLPQWLKANISDKQYQILVGDNNNGILFIEENGKINPSMGYTGLLAIWNSIYALKQNLAEQLEPQIQGMGQYINGSPAGEGFVFPTPNGLVKIVNRGVFGTAHFAKAG